MNTVTDFYGHTHTVYATRQDYIDHNLQELGDVTLTDEQAQQAADKLLMFFTMYNADGETTLDGFVEDPRKDFWDVIANVLGDGEA